MSVVTDLVFILPGNAMTFDQHRRYRDQFEDSFAAAHNGHAFGPANTCFKVMGGSVYAAGVNHIDHGWVETVRDMRWPSGTILWLDHEGVMDCPSYQEVYQLGPEGDQ